MKLVFTTLLLSLVFFSTASISRAQNPEENARTILDKHRPSLVVVAVEGKLTVKAGTEEIPPGEPLRRTLGITIADNGLIAVSNSAIDSAVGLRGQMTELDGKFVRIEDAKTEFTNVEISYGDSTIIKGKVVGQNVDADVAFVLPDQAYVKEVNKVFEKVDLTQFSESTDAADRVVGLSRASSAFNFMVTLVVGRITGVYKGREHTFFVNTAGSTHGMPIFALDGRPVGLTVERVINGKATGVLATISAASIEALAKQVKG